MYCGKCGILIPDNANFCSKCGQDYSSGGQNKMQQPFVAQQPGFYPPQTYGQPPQVPIPAQEFFLPSGNDPAALPYLKGWNWGGFFLSWIWAFSHEQITAGVIILVASIIPGIGFLVRMGYKVYFGLQGNELAWKSRRFESLKQFQDTQKVWAIWGGIIFGICILLYVIIFTLYMASIFYLFGTGKGFR